MDREEFLNMVMRSRPNGTSISRLTVDVPPWLFEMVMLNSKAKKFKMSGHSFRVRKQQELKDKVKVHGIDGTTNETQVKRPTLEVMQESLRDE